MTIKIYSIDMYVLIDIRYTQLYIYVTTTTRNTEHLLKIIQRRTNVQKKRRSLEEALIKSGGLLQTRDLFPPSVSLLGLTSMPLLLVTDSRITRRWPWHEEWWTFSFGGRVMDSRGKRKIEWTPKWWARERWRGGENM